jgi:hypothetical protein
VRERTPDDEQDTRAGDRDEQDAGEQEGEEVLGGGNAGTVTRSAKPITRFPAAAGWFILDYVPPGWSS